MTNMCATEEPLVKALLNRLPALGSEWSKEERYLWLHAMEATFNLIYRHPSTFTSSSIQMSKEERRVLEVIRSMVTSEPILASDIGARLKELGIRQSGKLIEFLKGQGYQVWSEGPIYYVSLADPETPATSPTALG